MLLLVLTRMHVVCWQGCMLSVDKDACCLLTRMHVVCVLQMCYTEKFVHQRLAASDCNRHVHCVCFVSGKCLCMSRLTGKCEFMWWSVLFRPGTVPAWLNFDSGILSAAVLSDSLVWRQSLWSWIWRWLPVPLVGVVIFNWIQFKVTATSQS